MSLLTDFLKLFKYDPVNDRDKTFNITQALNDNWDKLDTTLKSQDDAIAAKETPAGAQQKADAAEAAANVYTDQEVANVENELATHKADYTSFKNNIEAVKYEDDKLFLRVNGEWVEFKGKDGYPVGNVAGLSVTEGNGEINIKWQDPDDVTITDSNGNVITIARWKGTKLIRKAGSYPVNENDGTLVLNNTTRDKYKISGFKDTGLSNGTTYYYMLFPYTEEDVITIDSANRISATPQTYDDLTGSPGAKNLISGTMEEGFFGEVPASELITGDALASQIGLSAGTAQFSNEPWLKFAYQGKIQFVAKKPFRYGLSWDDINAANAVYGDRTVTIGGLTYKVRLMRGANKDPAGAYDGSICHGSEWNRLMLPIHENAPNNWAYPNNVDSPTEDWGVNYTDEDLLTHYNYGDGSRSWCQEVAESASNRVTRGISGVSHSGSNSASGSTSGFGWRPVLELL